MMNTTANAYRRSTATSWTRIDMLLALYDAALFASQHVEEAIRTEDQPALLRHQSRSQRLITELIAGVDVEQGELATNVHRLLTFCLLQSTAPGAKEWASITSILEQLREAFAQIRDEAARLEQTGQIPKLGQSINDATLAVG